MRIGTLFSGIGSPEQGASRVYNDLELTFACEWDKFARESFNANYEIAPEHFHQDISDMDGTQYKDKVDIIIGGSPCQDFSIAGLRAGIEGKKGVLIYEYIRIIEEVSPPIFIYENVKGMLSDKGGRTIKEFVEAFREMGYYCHYEVLNTKDYGVPQNRERIFLVGFKDHEHYYNFSFAPKQKLEKKLKDLLESDVDEKYYIKQSSIESVKRIIAKDRGYARFVDKETKYAKTFTRRMYDSFNADYVVCEKGIRKYTINECLELHNFDVDFKIVVPLKDFYNQVGNSISANVMEMIFNQIEKSRDGNTNAGGLF